MTNFLKKYLNRIDRNVFGDLENPTLSFEGSVCDTSNSWKDVVSVYMNIENGIVKEIKGKCGPCDPYAYITLYILINILKGENVKNISAENPQLKYKFVSMLTKEFDDDFTFHYEKILELIISKIK